MTEKLFENGLDGTTANPNNGFEMFCDSANGYRGPYGFRIPIYLPNEVNESSKAYESSL